MAALCRSIVGITRRAVFTTPVRAYCSKNEKKEEKRDLGSSGYHAIFTAEEGHKGKVEIEESEMPSNIGHMVGEERDEILREFAGAKDQFQIDGIELLPGMGAREKPIIVRSENNFRYVGCVCDEEQVHINYMVLKAGDPKRCECGFWYKLVQD